MTNFEKPKDWGVAPKTNWVSGKEIDPDSVKMPSLGDPGAHENASSSMSFGDDEEKGSETEMSLFNGRMVNQCPPGFGSDNGVCVPDPKSEAKLDSKIKSQTGHQWDRDVDGEKKGGKEANSFKRELPKVPTEADPQIRRLAKYGKREV